MPGPYAAHRPLGVTIVAILTWFVAFLSLVRGFLGLLGFESVLTVHDPTRGEQTLFGLTELAVGVGIAVVALGLSRGSSMSRFLVSALMILRIIAAVWVAMAFSGRGGLLAAVFIGGVGVLILLLLWNSRADRFFLQS